MARKKYSINVEDGKLVSVEVDGREYKDPEDIPDADDRDMVQMLIVGGPDLEPDPFENAPVSTSLPRVILWIFVGVAVMMGIITAIAAISTSRSMAREVSVPGRVVELLAERSSDGSTLYAPLVDFAGTDNERHFVRAGGASRPPAYEIGQPVTVRYDPADPETARIASFWGNVGQYTLALITGVLLLAFSAASWFAWWINRPDPATGEPAPKTTRKAKATA